MGCSSRAELMEETTDLIKVQHVVQRCQEKQRKEGLAREGRKYSLHCYSYSCWYAQGSSPINHPLNLSISIISTLKVTLLPQRWRQQVPPKF
jgi:hypothetical protein